jgi:accessory gene regulator protein AgrB
MKSQTQIPKLAKILAGITAIFFMTLGLTYILNGYVPAGYTKHGWVQAMFGKDAKKFGSLLILIGFLPLLLLAKNKRQATILGILLGTIIIILIFSGIYL